jgi:hypothetical protein
MMGGSSSEMFIFSQPKRYQTCLSSMHLNKPGLFPPHLCSTTVRRNNFRRTIGSKQMIVLFSYGLNWILKEVSIHATWTSFSLLLGWSGCVTISAKRTRNLDSSRPRGAKSIYKNDPSTNCLMSDAKVQFQLLHSINNRMEHALSLWAEVLYNFRAVSRLWRCHQ